MMNVTAISGSLRQGSYNTALVKTAQELAPSGMSITRANIGDIPIYNGDVENQGLPGSVILIPGGRLLT